MTEGCSLSTEYSASGVTIGFVETSGDQSVFSSKFGTIWKCRNSFFFNQTCPPLNENVVTSKLFTEEIDSAFDDFKKKKGDSIVTNYWMSPIAGKIKLNTDGSKRGEHGIDGFGGVLRDEDGLWIKGYMWHIGHSTVLEAELWGIYRGLIIIYEMNLQEVCIETDSQDATQCIYGDVDSNFPLAAIRHDIKNLLTRCQATISVIPREINSIADALAKSGRDQDETLVILDNAPIEIQDLVIQDMIHCGRKCI